MEPCAVFHLSGNLTHLLPEVFLPIWDLSRIKVLNDLWIERGKWVSDVYALGDVSKWSIRQLRSHRFIFISTNTRVAVKEEWIHPDIKIPRDKANGLSAKELETIIGTQRLKLRKKFGDMLREYAMVTCVEFHGSEAETLNFVDPRKQRVFGLPRTPYTYNNPKKTWRDAEDQGTSEKLVSMLDYGVWSADQVHYVGSGDLRTLKQFAQSDPKRFRRIEWFCYDPISPAGDLSNVYTFKRCVTSPSDLNITKRECANIERVFLWDVSTDKGSLDSIEWRKKREKEDRLGEAIFRAIAGMFSYGIIKHRVPEGNEDYCIYTSDLLPQPGAPHDMYELRNLVMGRGHTWVDRSHLTQPQFKWVNPATCRRMVIDIHGKHLGKIEKKLLYEYLHITRRDGLTHEGRGKRADLFYLTNRCNTPYKERIVSVAKVSEIATLWVSRMTTPDYDDLPMSRSELMLRLSGNGKILLDGNGAILFLMWRYPNRFKRTTNYDPAWAECFAVSFREDIPEDPIPELSLCRFIGLRGESSRIRLNAVKYHFVPDMLKSMSLDLSGHLYITLVSGSYVADLEWWLHMILRWSQKNAEEKVSSIKRLKGELIEWKEEKANSAWHLREDLIAAFQAFRAHCDIFGIDDDHIQPWVSAARDIS
uniref:Core protein VP4 n=2 Tax=Equine encephalosis virus TaxID=201490 RepID=A0A7U1BCD9_9REOV|nr:VP4 [Equine encephalosis virus 5]QQY96732.1 VP4 [Equine encephalosis virus 7]